eukprot:jgi/Botrbrau1/5193/Bobra.0172s0061.1
MGIEVASIILGLLANVVCYFMNENSIVHQKLKLPRVLIITNRAEWAPPHPQSFWAFDMLDPIDLVTSNWTPRAWLLGVRWFTLLFFCACLLAEGNEADGFGHEPGVWLVFFTNWTFTLFGLWGLLGVLLTHLAVWRTGRAENPGPVRESQSACSPEHREATLPRQWDLMSVSYMLLSQVVPVAVLFLSCFFWAIADFQRGIHADDIMKHSVINVVIFFDLFMSRTPLVSYHFEITVAYGSLYAIFMWIYHAASGHWVYQALDLSHPLAPVLYFMLPVLLFASFLVWWAVLSFREVLAKHRVRMSQCQAGPSGPISLVQFTTSGSAAMP